MILLSVILLYSMTVTLSIKHLDLCYSQYNHFALWTSLPWLPPPLSVPTSQGLHGVLTVAPCCFMMASGAPSNSKRPFLMRPTCRNESSGNNCYLWVIFSVLKQHFWLNVDILFPLSQCVFIFHTHLAHGSLIYGTNLHPSFIDFTCKEDYWGNDWI